MPDILTLHAAENSTFVVTVSFLDESGVAVNPNSVEWTLQSSDGTVINNRKDVVISTPSETEDIALQGDDLLILSSENGENVMRELTVEFLYNSDIGSDNPGANSVCFWLDRLGRYKVT